MPEEKIDGTYYTEDVDRLNKYIAIAKEKLNSTDKRAIPRISIPATGNDILPLSPAQIEQVRAIVREEIAQSLERLLSNTHFPSESTYKQDSFDK